MSRLLLLLIFALWMIGSSTPIYRHPSPVWLGVFFGVYLLVIIGMAGWVRWLSRHTAFENLHHHLRLFGRVLAFIRYFIPAWFAIGMLGPAAWGEVVNKWLGPLVNLNMPGTDHQLTQLALPGMLIGTLPALLAWMASVWAQFPADRTFREQSLLSQLDHDLPVHPGPTLWQYLTAQFRQQILFLALPILLIIFIRDAVLLGCSWTHVPIGKLSDFDDLVLLPAAAVVYIFAPEILRRVLDTRPLEDSPLRRRLDAICRRHGLRYRDILLWHTQHSMGNAAVVGIFPRMRYVLLSDLLLETMSDQQIEAVFAHELGHIVHRHMIWYVVFFGILMLASIGVSPYLEAWLNGSRILRYVSVDALQVALSGVSTFVAIFVFFGYISRRFERQADVFAARLMQKELAPAEDAPGSFVGQQGATIFASALQRVAAINNIPVAARSWCHGSIASRMNYLIDLSSDASNTAQFDRLMWRLYALMVLALLGSGAIALRAGLLG